MSEVVERLARLRSDVEAMGSLPLLPPDDYAEYAVLCGSILETTGELAASSGSAADPMAVAEAFYRLGLAVRRAGDALTSAEVFERAARFAEAHGIRRTAASALNSAGITLYQIGDFERARDRLDRAIAAAGTDDFGRVRAMGIRMNWGNVLHYQKQYEDAERVYLALSRDLDATAPELFASHSTFAHAEVQGMLRVNLAGNRCNWAHADAEEGLPLAEHTRIASRYLREAAAAPLRSYPRMTVRCLRAQLLVLEGRPEEAERMLEEIALVCGRDKELLPQLPQAYRYAAEASVARGDLSAAVVNCHRALESALTVANDVEERTVVGTFVEVLRLSSRCLLDSNAAAPDRARQFVRRGGDIVDRLVDFLERKDWYTGHSHSKAVATLSLRLLRVLGELDNETELAATSEDTMRLAATLHDIGKLALPWSLLNKIVPLNEAERSLIRTHPERGEEILRQVGLAEIGAITAEHHEMPTGLGYPRGVRDSSVLGTVIAVADAFEAMTSVNRRYRSPRPLAEAVREIAEGAGVQFDRRVARALVTLYGNKI